MLHENMTSLIRLAMLLMQKEIQSPNFSCNEIDVIVDSISPMKRIPQKSSISDELTPRSIALSCFGAMIMYIARKRCSESQENSPQLAFHYTSTCKIQRKLCQIESNNKEMFEKVQLSVPSFWNGYMPSDRTTPMKMNNSLREYLFHPSMYDVLSTFLIDASDTILPVGHLNHLNERTKERAIRLFSGIVILQHAKRQTLQSTSTVLIASSNIEQTIATKFFIIVAVLLNYAQEASGGDYKELIYVESLMGATVQFCDALQSFYQNYGDCDPNILVGCMESIRAMWSYYNSFCNEIGCCDLIDFIEARSSKDTNKIKQADRTDYLSGPTSTVFASSAIMYEFVRSYRCSFMACLETVFHFHQKKNVWKNNKESHFLFCIDLVCTLSQDLCSGLNALSGGMTQDLYRYYIQIIEDAVQAALDMSTKSIVQSYNDFDNDLLIDLKGNCLTASNALWNVICAFDMKIPVFKIDTTHLFDASS